VSDSSATAERIKTFIRATYDAAAEHFDDPPLSFWDHFGRRTVDVAAPEPGASILDVCCGAGASALVAAERVGPAGRVLAIDFAERLLASGRARARARGLDNVEFRAGDLTRLDVPDGSFDAVLCSFGVFFAPDLPGAMAGLWRAVRPGGALTVTTWGRRLLEPANTIYWEAVEAERPDLRPAPPAHAVIAEPDRLAAVFVGAGAPAPAIQAETLVHPVTPEDWWTIVLGSGSRMALDVMGAEAASRVRTAVLGRLERERVSEVVVDVLYARSGRPAPARA
jgi:ubiquinone/menaquinone biosynthesis C-methylase UbiE